jgi:hypothetical protein
MVTKQAHFVVLMILLAALPATGQAQDLNTVINNVTKAMGTANLKTIRYSGSGSSYTGGKNAVWLKSYTRDIDLGGPTSRVQIVREQRRNRCGVVEAVRALDQSVDVLERSRGQQRHTFHSDCFCPEVHGRHIHGSEQIQGQRLH